MSKSALAQIGERRGLKSEIARQLGITTAAVSLWQRIPAEHCPMVEKITGIPRFELRPDVYGHAKDSAP
jgi:DNA-binding transcriptional regulator YdaS (Cro superfamily)